MTGLVRPWVILGFGLQSVVYLLAGMVVLGSERTGAWRAMTERRKIAGSRGRLPDRPGILPAAGPGDFSVRVQLVRQ